MDYPGAAPSFKPYGLAGRPWEGFATAGLTAALGVILVLDIASPAPIEVTALVLIVVIAASWLLSTPAAVWVGLAALALIAAEVSLGALAVITATVEAAVVVAVAAASRFYAGRLRMVLEGTDADEPSVASSVFGLENLAHLIDASADGVAAVDADGRIRYANPAAIALLALPPASERQPRLAESIVADDRAEVLARLAPSALDVPTTLSFRVRSREGEVRDVACVHTQFSMRGRQLNCLVMWDTTEMKRFQLAANALAETAAALAVTQPLEDMLAAIARRVIEVTDAPACAVFLLKGSRSVRLAASWGLPPGYEAAANEAIKAGADPPVFQAVRTRKPVFVADLVHQIRTAGYMAPMRALVEDVPWRQAVAFPMIHAGRAVGGLSVYLRPEQRLDEPTTEFLSTIASQAASAAQVSRLVAAAQDHVAARERYRLSRELHDSLTQELYGIVLGAKSARSRLEADPVSLVEPLDYILELAEAGLADMRRLVLELRPEVVEKEGLATALGQIADSVTKRYGIAVATDVPSELDLPLDDKLLVYRIVQEALHNVVKHAHAQHARIRVAPENATLVVSVEDDGMGFDARETHPGHFGLASMRERAENRGGSIRFTTAGGAGTSVEVRLPLQEPVEC